ncbi:MAG TPA: peptidyl-prolyl cis-trans isomerase [Vicinamibacteria bacterium]|nr:peptidyl-prolyl cis-trans isomerase [Vicinamibacteria bacterium]
MALGFMRRHRRWLYVFLWVVIAAFIILYIPAFQGPDAGSPGDVYAEVGGQTITVGEFQKTLDAQRRRLEQLYPGRLDAATLEQLGLEEQTLSSLVEERLLSLEAERLGIQVDDETLASHIARAPELQRDGRFVGAAEIKRRLELSGLSQQEFEESFRSRLRAERLQALVTDGLNATTAEAETEFRRRNEQVKAEYVLVPAERFKGQEQATEDEVRARFEAKKEAYRLPEKRVVSYLLLDPASLESRVAVTEPELSTYYQEHSEEYKEEEQVCASHILIKVKATPEAKEGHSEDEARKLAQGALDQLTAGADFASLAKKISEDQGSAPNGGDLSCFGRGRMLPEFENAAFDLKPGAIAGPVKTAYGYHLIRVSARREERIPALNELKERIRQLVLARRARALAQEKMQAVATALRRGRGIEEVAQEQGLTAQKSQAFSRSERVPPLDSPQLVSRAFEIKKGEVVKEAFSTPRGYVFIAVAEIQETRLPALAEAQDQVKAELIEEKAMKKAAATAAEIRAKAEKDGLEKASAAAGLVRKETPSLLGRGSPLGDLGSSLALDEAAFALPEKTLSAPVPVGGGYAILRVLERKPFDAAAFAKEKDSLLASLREQRREQFFRAYMNQVRARYPVERRAPLSRPVA